MKGHVLPGKILVKQDDLDERTEAGVIIPKEILEKPHSGEVIIVGEETEKVKNQVSVGDKVLFSDHAGTVLHLDDKDISLKGDYVLLDQAQVLIIKR